MRVAVQYVLQSATAGSDSTLLGCSPTGHAVGDCVAVYYVAEHGEVQARAMRQHLEATARALGVLTAVLERVNGATRAVNNVISPEP